MILHYVTKEINSLLISNIVWWCLLVSWISAQKKNSYLRHAWQRSNINGGNCYGSAKFSPALWRDEHNVVNSTRPFLFQLMGSYRTVLILGWSGCWTFVLFSIDESQNVKLYWNVDAAKKGHFLPCWGEDDGMGGIWHLQRSKIMQNGRSRYCNRMGEGQTNVP